MATMFNQPSGARQQQRPGAMTARPSFQFPTKQPSGVGNTGTFGAPATQPAPSAFNPFKGGQMTGSPGGTKPMPGSLTVANRPMQTSFGNGRNPNMFGGISREDLLANPNLVSTLGRPALSRWNALQQPTAISGGGLQAPPAPGGIDIGFGPGSPPPAFGGNDTIAPPQQPGDSLSFLPLPMPAPDQPGTPGLPGVLPQAPTAFKGFGFENLAAPTGVDAQGLPIYAQRAQGAKPAWDMAGGANRGQLRVNPQTGQQEILMGSGQGGESYAWQPFNPNTLAHRQSAESFQRYGPNWTAGSGATSLHGSDIGGILAEQLGRQPTMQEVYDIYYGVGGGGGIGSAPSGIAMPGAFGG